jgi:hypothetical protein
MIPKRLKLSLLLLFFQVFLPARIVLADTGPKPTMDFEFKNEVPVEQIAITSGILYECEQLDCSDASPLEQLGPQGFSCEANSCHAMAYGFSPYHRLEIQFSDGETRQSNIFETAGFNSNYTVIVRPEELLVEARYRVGVFPRTAVIAAACLCALAGVGLLAGVIVLLVRRSQKK